MLALVEKITRSGGEKELPHTYIKQQTDTDEIDDEGRAAIAKKGQGDAHDRQHAGYHGNINEYLPKNHGGDTHRQQVTEAFTTGAGNVQTPKNEQGVKEN
jgi:hypothetical protein